MMLAQILIHCRYTMSDQNQLFVQEATKANVTAGGGGAGGGGGTGGAAVATAAAIAADITTTACTRILATTNETATTIADLDRQIDRKINWCMRLDEMGWDEMG